METVRILCVEQWIKGGSFRDTYTCIRRYNHGGQHIMAYGPQRFILWGDGQSSSFWREA